MNPLAGSGGTGVNTGATMHCPSVGPEVAIYSQAFQRLPLPTLPLNLLLPMPTPTPTLPAERAAGRGSPAELGGLAGAGWGHGAALCQDAQGELG